MRTPALALAWQLWGRHRRALLAALACWLLAALLTQVLPAASFFRQILVLNGFAMVMPYTLFHLALVFAYGFEMEGMPLEARASCFPARMFALPVRTRTLVGWPMFHGVLAVALTWIAWALFVLRPNGANVRLWWPAFLLAAIVAWLQAVLWVPFPLPYVRIFLAVALPFGLGAVALVGDACGVSEPVLAGLFAVLLPPAYGLAVTGVARARHGDVSEWRLSPAGRPAAPRPRAGRQPFPSPAAAQLWYEWRRHGISFPLLLGCLLALSTTGALFLARFGDDAVGGGAFTFLIPCSRDTRLTVLVFHPLLLLPLFLASMLGSGLGSLGSGFQPSPFLLTRPLESGALVRVKLWTAAWSTLAGVALLFPTALCWLLLTGTAANVAAWWRQVLETYPATQPWVMLLLALVGFVGLIWLQLGKGLVVGLLGRLWVYWFPCLGLGFLVGLILFREWLPAHPEGRTALWALLPWLLGTAVLLKLLAVGTALRLTQRRQFWPVRPLAVVLAVWLVVVGCLVAVLDWLMPAGPVPLYLLAFGVVLVSPLARILAAPLALEWGRHR